MVKAKPFPSQFRIGVDVAHIPRFKKLISQKLITTPTEVEHANEVSESLLHDWARKVLSRLEWQHYRQHVNVVTKALSTDKNANVGIMAQWIAGRWAAKEAAVKAHSPYRRLTLPEISVVTSNRLSRITMLIDPPQPLVKMSHAVAEKRGLKPKTFKAFKLGLVVPSVEAKLSGIYFRPKLVRPEDRQTADLSISHDGEYAVALVQAIVDPSSENNIDLETIEDDGNGEPIHQPRFGDAGFLDVDPFKDI